MYTNNWELCMDCIMGIHDRLIATSTNTNKRPATSCSLFFAFGLNIQYMSTVKMVALELKMELNEDISAANITDIISPRTPSGSNSVTNFIKAKFVHPDLRNIPPKKELE